MASSPSSPSPGPDKDPGPLAHCPHAPDPLPAAPAAVGIPHSPASARPFWVSFVLLDNQHNHAHPHPTLSRSYGFHMVGHSANPRIQAYFRVTYSQSGVLLIFGPFFFFGAFSTVYFPCKSGVCLFWGVVPKTLRCCLSMGPWH